MSIHSRLRTEITRASRPIVIGDPEHAAFAYEQARPIIDSMAGKAARHKSRLNKRLQALSAE